MVQSAKNRKKTWKSAKKLKKLQINQQRQQQYIQEKPFQIKTETPKLFVENKNKPKVLNGISSKISVPH